MKTQINTVPELKSLHQEYTKLTKFLIANKITITTMESCTSGFIASLLTDTEGSSAVFKGGAITYSNEAKIAAGVSETVINESGVYSEAVAKEMAVTGARNFNAQIGIGITGTFGNVDPANSDSVPGEVYISIYNSEFFASWKIILPVNITRFESKLCVSQEVALKLEELLKL